jgi:hypothetical protein
MWRKLKDLLKNHLPYPLLMVLYYGAYAAVLLPRSVVNRRRAGLPRLDVVDLFARKSSETLFILGSGSSINRISDARWKAIAKADSVGFNFWLYHAFVPTFYCYEASQPGTARAEEFLRLAESRSADYASVIKFTTDLFHRGDLHIFGYPRAWKANHYAVHTIPACARSNAEFARLVSWLKRCKVFNRKRTFGYLFKHCGTLSAVVTFAANLGYRNVVLCGVDLNDPKCFYQDQRTYPDAPELELVQIGGRHPTLSRYAWGTVPINVVLDQLTRQVLDPAGVALYVEHAASALYPTVPLAPDSLYEALLCSNCRLETSVSAASMELL